jgi:hypothetical protein
VGGTKCRPLIFWRRIKAARRAQARLAIGQNEVRSCAILILSRICFALKKNFCYYEIVLHHMIAYFNGRLWTM